MTWPEPTREDHDRFCRAEGWSKVRDARGRTGTHHVTYELHLPDGRTLRTRISHPPDRTGYGKALWAHILRDQLDIGEDEFWACVKAGHKPSRSGPQAVEKALPADLVHLLLTRVRLTEQQVAELSKEEAVVRLQRFWLDGS